MSENAFHGIASNTGNRVTLHSGSPLPKPEVSRARLIGFKWGNDDPAAFALAYCILHYLAGQRNAEHYAKTFNKEVIMKLTYGADFTLSYSSVFKWIEEHGGYVKS